MTTARTLSQVIDNVPPKNPKKIEFLFWINTDAKKFDTKELCVPNDFDNVVLLSTDNGTDKDVMFAYNEDPMNGCLYLGNWNDGVA